MASETRQDPERIYLEPAPYSPEGRLWCEDAVWPLDGDGPGGVEYIRSDLHATEIARLTRELEEARRERSAARAEVLTAQASLRRVERVLEEARALLRELTEHEPVLDDERLRYVEIQVDREAWEAARSAVCAHPSDRSESDDAGC